MERSSKRARIDSDDKEPETEKIEKKKEKQIDENDPRRKRKLRRKQQRMIMEYYREGSSYGLPASTLLYYMSTQLGLNTNDLLWFVISPLISILLIFRLCILGLTEHFLYEKISFTDYQDQVTNFKTDVLKFNDTVEASQDIDDESTKTDSVKDADDQSIVQQEEFRLMLLRHWSLYDSLYHSSYVATRLGIWKERGRQKLIDLLTNSGFPLKESHQNYRAMHARFKKDIAPKLRKWAPQFNMPEIEFPSFIRNYGYRLTLTASDAVYALTALMDCGAEWIKKHATSVAGEENSFGEVDENKAGQLVSGVNTQKLTGIGLGLRTGIAGVSIKKNNVDDAEKEAGAEEDDSLMSNWVRNFYVAYDALYE